LSYNKNNIYPAVSANNLSQALATHIVNLVRTGSGISVDPANRGFLELRVSRRLRELQIQEFSDYESLLQGPDGQAELQNLVEMLATHTTSFFREKNHFDWLATEGLGAMLKSGAGREWNLTIWSAACSIGSELWSAGMVVDQYAQTLRGGMRWQMIGTDISRRILKVARNATFTDAEIQGIEPKLHEKYVMKSKPNDGENTLFRIVPELRQKAEFFLLNLTRPSPKFAPLADVVFLRNVLIYFGADDRRAVLAGIIPRMRSGGFLLTGHSEHLSDLPRGLVQVGSSIYQKVAV